jgi:methylmalonyl-CoA mutase N-terminal domain/subunit
LRTQQIIAEESGVANTVDPLGGSYFVEAMTDRIEQQAYDYFRRVEDLGGVIPAIEKGFFQSEIADAAYRYQREIDEGIRKIVGVNAYAEKKPLMIPILEMDPQGYDRQVARLKELRKTRDNGHVGQALDRLRMALEGTENTMPYIMEAVHSYATLGEIIQVMKEVFGVYDDLRVAQTICLANHMVPKALISSHKLQVPRYENKGVDADNAFVLFIHVRLGT